MSTDAVSRTASTNAVVPHAHDQLADILAVARTINARPSAVDSDSFFVYQVLGKDMDSAKKEYRRLMKLLHPQRTQGMGVPPEQLLEIGNAFNRTTRCWAASEDGKNILVPGALEFTGAKVAVASVIIMAAAHVAETGLRHVRETWQRKVEDGTVDRVRAQFASTASDLFAVAAAGWRAAISRKPTKKD